MSLQRDRFTGFTGVAKSLTSEQRAKIAAFRFGMGPKKNLIKELGSSPNAAFNACWAELTSPTASRNVMIPADLVHRKRVTAEQDMQICCFAGGNDIRSGSLRWTEMGRRCAKHMEPRVGFVERLVLFWSNYFSITQFKSPAVRSTVGHFERTVIRGHVLGNFSDMLKAALTHPAMIGYLDNQASNKNAVNENLARETLELYTVGTQMRYPHRTSDYTQQDVTSLARILTGWSRFNQPGHPGNLQFEFQQGLHDERPHEVMGQSFSAAGQGKGLDALDWLAKQTHTAENVATRLLRHFGWDEPPADAIARLRDAFIEHRGNLLELAKALLRMEEVWAAPARLRPPHLWVMAQARALGFREANFTGTIRANNTELPKVQAHWYSRLNLIDNQVWGWLTPDGFPEQDSYWIHPDAMRMRPIIAIQLLRDAEARGYVLPEDPDALRRQLLPGSVRVTQPTGQLTDRTRA